MQPDNEQRTARIPRQRDPAADSVPSSTAGPVPEPAIEHTRRSGRRNLLVFLVVGVLAAVASATLAGIAWYARETAPDRSAPDVAVDNYLRALLVERDDPRASLWACGDRSELAEIESFRREISAREEQLQLPISVNLEDLRVEQRSGREATLTVAVRRSALIDGSQQSVVDRFQMTAVNDDGWRVCAARKAPG